MLPWVLAHKRLFTALILLELFFFYFGLVAFSHAWMQVWPMIKPHYIGEKP